MFLVRKEAGLEINEQAENMKQIQEALSNPIGAAADFDESLPTLVSHSYDVDYHLTHICDGGGSEVTPFADRKNKKLKWRSEYKQKKSIASDAGGCLPCRRCSQPGPCSGA
ncbi:hypothetical protein MKW98_004568 [Papaver atlanticum]|uniref:Uncharacterized protein n=1 Tax=Papaver atlanticum TaxID=357466 RepID=A0AAD4XJF5_9MAGN|nr:hypothetical protein MKW98_004568 [Papaver atlanticum]